MNLNNILISTKKIALSLVITLISITAFAQESPTITFNGSIDTYFRTNLNAPNAGENTQTPGSSFANLPGFSLGMANLIASYEGEEMGFVADLVFGPRGTDAIFASPMYSATGSIVNQLYAYWNVSDKLTLSMGNFNTFLGYEVIAPAANFNYSTSYLFSYGPFSHTGIKADIDLGNDLSLMLAVLNPTDLTEFNPMNTYAFGAQLGYKGQFLNFLTDNGAYEIDFTGGFDLSDDFFLGVNAAKFDADGVGFTGVALYPQLQTSDSFSIGLRGEYFSEQGDFGAIGSGIEDSDVFALTLTGSASIGNLIIKPEFRLDSSSDPAFLNKSLTASKSLSSFLIAAIVSL